MGAGRGLRRETIPPLQCAARTGLCPLPFQTQAPQARGLSNASPGSGTRNAVPSAWPGHLDACDYPWPHPGDTCPATCQMTGSARPTSCPAAHPALISAPTATLAPTTLALPFVFFSFLQTRQATKVLNATRVPSDSPPATMMPSSGTSTRVARSPAGGPLVRFQEGMAPNSGMPQVRLCPPCPRWLGTAHSQASSKGQQVLPFLY